jgi:tryptophan 2,3-dioxygenase
VSGAELHYRDYLRLSEILNAQSPRHEPASSHELHFIITHQALELWFKLMVHELGRARQHILDEEWSAATMIVKQVTEIALAVLAQMRTLHHMPPDAFHQFRPALGTASGVQSSQFREIEVLCGLRAPAYLDALAKYHGGSLPDAIGTILAAPSLADVLATAPKAAGLADWVELYRTPARAPELYVMAEQLVDYDDVWYRWRCEHIALVERIIGSRRAGTAGTSIGYLHRTLEYRFFPFLWDARNRLP